MCVCVPECMYVQHMYVCMRLNVDKRVSALSGTGVMGGC